MPVYVDDMAAPFGRMRMSHMIADTEQELHAMADRIGVARRWFQRDHYDISQGKRKLAIQAGAVELGMRDLARKFASFEWVRQVRARRTIAALEAARQAPPMTRHREDHRHD